jgi:hypothetical protein
LNLAEITEHNTYQLQYLVSRPYDGQLYRRERNYHRILFTLPRGLLRGLSATMIEHLLYLEVAHQNQGGYSTAIIRCGRPSHYENLRTHNALLRRGLIAEADDDFHTTTLTETGDAVIRWLRERNQENPRA